MKRTLEILGATLPAGTPAAKATGTALATTPPAAVTAPPPTTQQSKQYVLTSVLPGLAAGALGAVLWGDHRVLGFFGGAAVGANVYPIVKGTNGLYDRRQALCAAGATGAAVAASLGWHKHPALGYLGGLVGASVALRVTGMDKGGAA